MTKFNKYLVFALLGLYSQADTPSYDHVEGSHVYVRGDSVIDTIQGRGLLKVGVGLFEPWIMCDTNGDLMGYEIDVANELADDMDVHIQYVRTDWYFIIPALIEERFDMIVSGMSITPERSLLINFSIPYSEFGTLLLANSASVERPQSQDDFNAPEVVFGARAGTIPAEVVNTYFPQANLLLFDSDSELIESILAGEIQVLAADQVTATHWLNTHPNMLYKPFAELFSKVPEAIGLRRGDLDGLNFLNSWIEHHRSSGWLNNRRTYWFETRDWEELRATDPQVVEECEASFSY